MPAKVRLSQAGGDYYAVMPCLWEKKNLACVKMIGRHVPGENEKRPAMMADMLLYEANTGVLKALLDAEYITTLRTGAAAAHAAILYGKRNFRTLGLIGLGNIMTVCLHVLLEMNKDKAFVVRLHKHNGHEKRFRERFALCRNVQFVECETYEETVKGADVVISAVTSVYDNFCDDACYEAGCTVIPIMTRGFQNCDLFFDQVFTDEIEQIRGFRYFDRFKSVKNTSDVLGGHVAGRLNDEERVLVYNYGLALQDLYFADKICEKLEDAAAEVNYRYCREKHFM